VRKNRIFTPSDRVRENYPPRSSRQFNSTGDQQNTDPLLNAIDDNGGPTETMSTQASSPAINAGDDTICAASPVSGVDQRGVTRPALGATHCAVGAFESCVEYACNGIVMSADFADCPVLADRSGDACALGDNFDRHNILSNPLAIRLYDGTFNQGGRTFGVTDFLYSTARTMR